MINLNITSENDFKVNKRIVHRIIHQLTKEFDLRVNSLTVNFVTLKTILEVNVKYLNHNYTTDIITFSYSENLSILDGDIFISVEDVRQNAKKYNCTFQLEVLRVIIHGILHMIGFDDKNSKDKLKMKKMENSLVIKYSSILKLNKIVID